MPDNEIETIKFLLPKANVNRDGSHVKSSRALPWILGGGASRSGVNDPHDLFINERAINVDSVFDLSGTGRDGNTAESGQAVGAESIVALEARDGTSLIVRADKLKEDLERLYPGEAVGKGLVNIKVLTDRDAAARGLGEWIWSKLSLLELSPDGIVESAKDKALEILKDKLGEHVEELVSAHASWAGAKALMWAVESRLVGEPGLYHWHQRDMQVGDRVREEDPGLVAAAEKGEPILVFIHGTASGTGPTFGGLHEGTTDEGRWEKLTQGFAGRVYGFEHHTFSASPLENALQLVRTLPKGSRISLITHSRGGLVGDLLCLGEFDDDLVSRYQREPISGKKGDEEVKESPENKKLRERVVAEEKEQLLTLRAILKEKAFKIDRYVRIAAPASGTTLLSENLDVFLSGLLSLLNMTVSLIPGVGAMGSTALSAFRRIVLEIAGKRIDPRLIPGIEPMLPNSPLTIFLAQAPRNEQVQMSIVSGNIDGDSGHYLKRIAVMMTDWILFDQFDNDLMVDTQSMRAGLARRNKTREYYAHGHQVNHFRYFDRHDTRRAIYKWITDEKPEELAIFHPVPTDIEVKLDNFGNGSEAEADRSGEQEQVVDKHAPIVIYLPDIMGTHLEIRKPDRAPSEGDRVWFDPFHLTLGGIAQLSMDKDNVRPEGVFRRYYGELEAHLKRDHEVIPFAYDWRQSILVTAKELTKLLKQTLDSIKDQPQRQISILAHGMGGLVVRAMIAQDEGSRLWDKVVEQTHGHFVMLGTPNQGSHQIVENLMGKSGALRQLAMLDFQHDLQEIIDIMADFEGVLQLLPPEKPDGDQGGALPKNYKALNYQKTSKGEGWDLIRRYNKDRWFGDGMGAKPALSGRKSMADFWKVISPQNDVFPHADHVAYVYGLAGHTPNGAICNLERECLELQGTTRGDGAVTWQSGRLSSLGNERYWYMPVSHASLTNSAQYFDAIVDLLRRGSTQKLDRKASRTRSAVSGTYRYDAGPALQPGAEDLTLSFFGGPPVRDTRDDDTQLLEVSVRAMDLRFVQSPILCGHYLGDSIAGAEALIDSQLVKGALSQRERLGIYAGDTGTHTIVLNPQTPEEKRRGTGRGAIIAGLGEWDKITAQSLTGSVRDAVLQYLLHSTECAANKESADSEKEVGLSLSSLLVGYNSTTHITVEASIEAIVLGVCEANQQYRHNKPKQQPGRAVRKLEFIEYYMDTAISAAYAVRDLSGRLEKDLQRFDARLVVATELQFKQGDGAQDRLHGRSRNTGYWARLMVTDADASDDQCTEACYEKWLQPAMPKRVRDALQKQFGNEPSPKSSADINDSEGVFAERIKYVYLSERARAEALVQQRQPGLIEALIKKSIRDSSYDPDICRTLFQLMVPLDFKPAARQTQQLLMVLDGYTANLPWEMLQADDEPLALKIAMVRQLVSTRYRKSVTGSLNKTACVIGNPSTADFHKYFDLGTDREPDEPNCLPSLEGATTEALEVAKTLGNVGYDVKVLCPKKADQEPSHTAIQVFNALYKQPYRILMIAAHGEVNVPSRRDGKLRTGVVLSDGVMLTAAEIGQMEVVPDLVFLNCCHLAKVDNSAQAGNSGSYNRLAYSVSRELIEMGVRCVIAAGWAVNDSAARTFSTHFFELFSAGEAFGKAVWEARKKTNILHPNLNTWGAYQAYGDPNYVLHTDKEDEVDSNQWMPVAPQELMSALKKIQVDSKRSTATEDALSFVQLVDRVEHLLKRVPDEWVRKPGIQYILAELYGSMLPEGFNRAEAACLQAIIHEDKEGQVPLKALELLGNLEARQAEKLSEKVMDARVELGKADTDKQRNNLQTEIEQLTISAVRLSQSAIDRLRGLLHITHKMYEQGGSENSVQCEVNAERFALLGSALKRKAMMQAREEDVEWDKILPTLKECITCYEKGEGVGSDLNFNPYLTINCLQLQGVLGISSSQQVELAQKAREITRKQFVESLRFFDGVMVADAVVAIFLLNDAVFKELMGEDKQSHTFLIDTFKDAIQSLHYSRSEFNSVTNQLESLSIFLEKRAGSSAESDVVEVAQLIEKTRTLAKVAAALKKL